MITPRNAWRFWLVGAGVLLFLYLVRSILLPFIVGMIVAYLLDPVADRLEKYGLSRFRATILITILFFLLVALGLVIILPILYNQFMDLLNALPQYAAMAEQRFMPMLQEWLAIFDHGSVQPNETLANISSSAAQVIGDFAGGVLRSGMAVLNIVSLLLITPVVTFYLLRDWDEFIAHAKTLLPTEYADTIISLARQIDRALAGFVRGQLNACMVMGLYYAIGLTLAGLKFGIVIGFMAGFLMIVPYAGSIISGIISVGLAFIQFDDLNRVLIVAAIFIVGQTLEGNIVTPRFVGDRVGLHPVWILFGMLSGAALFGFVGVLLAVPVTAVLSVLIRFFLARYKAIERSTFHS